MKDIIDKVLQLSGEEIMNFYQIELPIEIFDEEEFNVIKKNINVEDDLLMDLEKLYKAQISFNKYNDTDY